jgi:DNA (cytosine-5)-methyltransferase 1
MSNVAVSEPTVLDLFSGVGGFSLGFGAAGYRVVGANDFDDEALEAFRLNHPGTATWSGPIESLSVDRVLEDTGLSVGELDVLVGGPPCQGFSQNRARRHYAGRFVDDPRNYLFKEFLRFVDGLRPRVVVIENVPQLLIKEDGKFAREIAEYLDGLGYSMSSQVLSAADYGVPQKRKRAIILAGRDRAIPIPATTHGAERQDSLFPCEPHVSIWDAIGDLPRLAANEGSSPCLYDREPETAYQKERRGDLDKVTDHIGWPVSKAQAERISHLGEGDGWEKLPVHLQPKSGYGSAYRRMARDMVALTITTWMYHPGSGMFIHPVDDRVISLREGARLQSFDDDVVFYGGKVSRCRQVGNAVPPLMAKAIASAVLPYVD